MRSLRRPKVCPPTLQPKGDGGRLAAAHEEAYRKTGRSPTKPEIKEHWREPDVKGALYAMQGSVCCYCSREMHSDATVEHFRPRSRYWWLAYSFSNYYLACEHCNRKLKKDEFPLVGQAFPCVYEEREILADEPRALLDPGTDAIDDWIDFNEVEKDKLRVTISPNCPPERRHRVEHTISRFQLNRDLRLIRSQSEAFHRLIEACRDGKWERARELTMRHRPFGFVARAALRRVRPKQLPTDEQELISMVAAISRQLEDADWPPEGSPLSDAQVAELCWAMAVLLLEAAGATAAFVEAALSGKPWESAVRDFARRLSPPPSEQLASEPGGTTPP